MKSTNKTNKILVFLKFALPFIIVSPLFINAQEIEEVVISGSFIPVSYTHLTLPTNREV